MATRKKSPAKIIESELDKLGEKVFDEVRGYVRVSKTITAKDGGLSNTGGTLRDSINYYPKGRKLTMSQINYGKYQKPKKLGSTKWTPPKNADSDQWENPLADSIKKNIPDTINVISKSLLGYIVGPIKK